MLPSDRALDHVFHALADPTRRAILMQVRADESSVSDIANRFEISLPAVSKHLGVLERAGLIDRRKKGRQRLCRAVPDRLDPAARWLAFYQAFWSERLDRLQAFVEQATHSNDPEEPR